MAGGLLALICAVVLTIVLVGGSDAESEATASTGLAELAQGPSGAGGAGGQDPAGIVGGTDVRIEQFPWQVALVQEIEDGRGRTRPVFICGGSLLTPTIVLTAAHCVADNQGRFTIPADKFTVISGRTNLSSGDGLSSLVSEYHFFTQDGRQRYNPTSKAWDLTLLELSTPALGTPIRIAGADEAATWAPNTTAWVSGWGSLKDDTGPYPDTLRAVAISVLPDSACLREYRRIHLTSFCAGHPAGGRDTCSGDSGGPLTVALASGEVRLAGATSWGALRCGQPGVPGVYAAVAADPMRSALQGAVLGLGGVDILGAGGVPTG